MPDPDRSTDRDADSKEPRGRRLESWKEIAAYLHRDVATVRRWEKREALPVHRHVHDRLGSVYAYVSELDRWREGRRQSSEGRHWGRLEWRPAGVAIAVLLLAVSAGLGMWWRDRAAAGGGQTLRLAVHRPGTVAGLIMTGLADLANRQPGFQVETIELPGMMSTLRALDRGEVDVGLAFNLLAFHAVKTDQLLGHRSEALTALTVAYATPAQIVVASDSDVKSPADLKGKRVSLGIAESGERFCSEIMLSHFGLSTDDFSDHARDFAPSLNDVLEGRLDAYITWRAMPTPDFSQAFATGKLRMIPLNPEVLEGLRVKHPFLGPWTIPPRVYPKQESAVPTVAGRILLLASRSLSPASVENLLQAVEKSVPDLIARHPAAADINLTRRPTLADGLSIDLHPGAELFFRSAR